MKLYLLLIKNFYSKDILKRLVSFQYIKIYERILKEKNFKKMGARFFKIKSSPPAKPKIFKFNFMALIEVQMRDEYFFARSSTAESN